MNKNSFFIIKCPLMLRLLLIAFLSVVFCSCSNPDKELNKKINIAIRSGNNIDENEWNDLSNYILKNKKDFPDLVQPDGGLNVKELTRRILKYAHDHNRAGEIDPDIYNPLAKATVQQKPKVRVFIDNSGSMDGYVRGTTDFEAALSDLLVQFQYFYGKDNLQVNFINTKSYPAEIKSVEDFVQALDPDKKASPYTIGDGRNVTKLNEILKMILDSTSTSNISVLISDCIYSIEKDRSTVNALEFEKSLTKGAFLEKSKDFDFATIVLKLKSNFTGTYWDKDNNREQLNGEPRPYYIWIIGKSDYIDEFAKSIKMQSLKGFENSYSLSDFTKEKPRYYCVLMETNKIGSFRPENREVQDVTGIKDIRFDKNMLQFSVAVDLSNIPVDSSYLADPRNFIVPEGFTIKEISRIKKSKLSPHDMLNVQNTAATHFITVSTSSKFKIQNLDLELANQIPRWVDAGSSLNDGDVKSELDKTFGLSYLIRGVSEAYSTRYSTQNAYFKISVKINP